MTGSEAILVIEDDRDIREILHIALESEGYQVNTANHGREGLNLLKSGLQPALILLDMSMPIMGGKEFLQLKQGDPDLAPIPVVVVSAYATDSETEGAVATMKKPVELETLLQVVQSHRRQNPHSR